MTIALSAAVVTALLGGLVIVRYVTFDPKQFVDEVQDHLNPLRPTPPGTGRAAGEKANAEATPLLPPIPSDPAARVRQFEGELTALRHEYHTAKGPCFRYPAKDDLPSAPEKADEVVDAFLAAGLVGRLDALLPVAARWTRDADNATHRLDPAREVVDHFANEASFWTWLGVALRGGAIREAAQAVLKPAEPPTPDAPLSPEEEARAKPLWERFGYGHLLQGAMRVPVRMHVVDLRAARLRLLEPEMAQSEVRARLGAGDEEGTRWRYPRFGTEVTFDERGHVIGIASSVAPGDQVIVDGIAQRDLREASLARIMGKPLRDGQADGGETVLVYDLGPQAMVLVFVDQLVRVEVWRKDLIMSAH